MTTLTRHDAREIGRRLTQAGWDDETKPHLVEAGNAIYDGARLAEESGQAVQITITVTP